MKKRVLFLGMILSIVNIVKAETGMSEDVKLRFEKNEAYVKAIRDKSMEVLKLANSNLEFSKVNDRNFIAVNKETEANTEKTKVNETKIIANKAEMGANKENTVANAKDIGINKDKTVANTKSIETNKSETDKKLEEADEKFKKHEVISNQAIDQLEKQDIKLGEADEKFKQHEVVSNQAIKQLKEQDERLGKANKKFEETDKELIKADARIEANVKGLQKHDDAVYESIGTTRSVYSKGVKVVKADINRNRIIVLENQTRLVGTNKADIADNKINIANNRNEINQEKVKTDNNTKAISSNRNQIYNNTERIGSLEGKVDGLETEMKKGFAMAAAMSSIDFQVLDVGDAGFGFGVGNYKNSEAVSLGVGVRPTENVTLNIKRAMFTGKGQETMVGGGAIYKFNLFGG